MPTSPKSPRAKRSAAHPPAPIAPAIDAACLRKPAHLRTRGERREAGRALRVVCPREAHAGFTPAKHRADPIDLLIASSLGRIERLVPIRYGRMLASPFAFFRGAASIMAADLAGTPSTGLAVQACGDCHLLNFGALATPERRLIFDINDFDETFPAPWEWDLKRLATSFVIASRHNGHKASECRAAAANVARQYAAKLRELSSMNTLDAWYDYLDWPKLIELGEDEELKQRRRRSLAKAMARDSAAEFTKLASIVDGKPRIKDAPPLIFHAHEHLAAGFEAVARENLGRYRESLPPERRVLLDRYEIADVAVKVVGVGSVGTMCMIALLFAADADSLFLQLKEARPSVLEPYVEAPSFATHGERVVFGQRLMQTSSDLFLGHMVSSEGRHVYVRQLRDVKVKPMIELYSPTNMLNFARYTGWALARAHARSGDAAMLAGYIGKSDVFPDAIAHFAVDYAEQNLRDHAALVAAVRAGRIDAVMEPT